MEFEDNLSVNSISTIASEDAEEIIQQQINANNYSEATNNQVGLSNVQNNIRVENSEGVHIGDAFNNFYINIATEVGSKSDENSVQNDKIIKSSTKITSTKIQCHGKNRKLIILAIVISFIVIVITISILLTYILLFKKPIPIYNFPEALIRRDQWGANPPKASVAILSLPIKRIIVGHTGGSFCQMESECREVVKSIQIENSDLDDIPYNYLIGEDGRVYEGRGVEYAGQHTDNPYATEFNSIGICVAFMGNYNTTKPTENQLELLKSFIQYLVEISRVAEDYLILSQDSLIYRKIEADELNDAISGLSNYYSLQKVYRREEWKALPPNNETDRFNQTADWILLSHSVTSFCFDIVNCSSLARTMQLQNLNVRNFSDVMFNFYIGGDGIILEGRGWDIVAAHTSNYNSLSIGIVAIGNFTVAEPSEKMIEALFKFFDDAVALGKLKSDFIINGRQDFRYPGPGDGFMKYVREWCRYGNRTTECNEN